MSCRRPREVPPIVLDWLEPPFRFARHPLQHLVDWRYVAVPVALVAVAADFLTVEIFAFVRIRWNAQSDASFGILDENHDSDGSEEQHCCVWVAATMMTSIPCGRLFRIFFGLSFLPVSVVVV